MLLTLNASMTQKAILSIFLVLITSNLLAQSNLVPNPSFEVLDSCPTSSALSHWANGWVTNINSTDYFHACTNPNNQIGVPANALGYQCPSTGRAYCGLLVYNEPFPDGVEFIGRELSIPLTTNEKYYFSCKLSLSGGIGINCGIDKFGVLFTNVNYGFSSFAASSLANNTAHYFDANIITDTAGWITIFGSFIADSNYSYMLIGNFFDTTTTNTACFDSNTQRAYYYIDDVCVSVDSLTCVNIASEIIDFVGDSTLITQSSCIGFSINSQLYYDSYEWLFPGATPSFSSDSFPTSICYDSIGNFDVILIVSDSSGCADTITRNNYITVLDSSVGIDKNAGEQYLINIYPNPTKNIIQIEVGNTEKLEIAIYNLLGELVYKKISYSVISEINLSEEAPGVYLVKIEANNQIVNKLIVLDP